MKSDLEMPARLILAIWVPVGFQCLLLIFEHLPHGAGLSIEAFHDLSLQFERFAFGRGVHHFSNQVPQFLRGELSRAGEHARDGSSGPGPGTSPSVVNESSS